MEYSKMTKTARLQRLTQAMEAQKMLLNQVVAQINQINRLIETKGTATISVVNSAAKLERLTSELTKQL
jgi:hypothetical protein